MRFLLFLSKKSTKNASSARKESLANNDQVPTVSDEVAKEESKQKKEENLVYINSNSIIKEKDGNEEKDEPPPQYTMFETFSGPIYTPSPVQSILLNNNDNIILMKNNNYNMKLQKEDLLHNFITGEDKRNLINSAMIESTLENHDINDGISVAFSFEVEDKSSIKSPNNMEFVKQATVSSFINPSKDSIFKKIASRSSNTKDIPKPLMGEESPISNTSHITFLPTTTPCTTDNSELLTSTGMLELSNFSMQTRLDVVGDYEYFK